MILPGDKFEKVRDKMRSFCFSNKIVSSKSIAIHAKTGNNSYTILTDQALMSEFFSTIYIGNMNFHYRSFYCSNCIRDCNRCMGITTSIEYDSVNIKSSFMQFINK